MANKHELLPPYIQWADWVSFTKELLSNIDHSSLNTEKVNQRYQFGELRLDRLNMIYRFTHLHHRHHFVSGYMYRYDQYSVFFGRNFGWILLVFVYISVILSALQVGLASQNLQDNKRFQQVAYGFTAFSLLSFIVIVGVAVIVFLYLVLHHAFSTRGTLKEFQKRRQESGNSKTSKAP